MDCYIACAQLFKSLLHFVRYSHHSVLVIQTKWYPEIAPMPATEA
jgi:hypothetical protein